MTNVTIAQIEAIASEVVAVESAPKKRRAKKAETVTVEATNAKPSTEFQKLLSKFTNEQVESQVTLIKESFERRNLFEVEACKNSKSSYVVERNKCIGIDAHNLARFLLALNVEPSKLIERTVNASNMFNAKALKKIRELANALIAGRRSDGSVLKIEKVMTSFILCSLKYSDGEAISNKMNKNFLSSNDLSDMVNDAELADYLRDYQHTYMTGGKDTQSSQARCVLEALKLGEVCKVDSVSRGGIKVYSKHSFYSDFCDLFLLQKHRDALLAS